MGFEETDQRLFARHLFCAVIASCRQVSGADGTGSRGKSSTRLARLLLLIERLHANSSISFDSWVCGCCHSIQLDSISDFESL